MNADQFVYNLWVGDYPCGGTDVSNIEQKITFTGRTSGGASKSELQESAEMAYYVLHCLKGPTDMTADYSTRDPCVTPSMQATPKQRVCNWLSYEALVSDRAGKYRFNVDGDITDPDVTSGTGNLASLDAVTAQGGIVIDELEPYFWRITWNTVGEKPTISAGGNFSPNHGFDTQITLGTADTQQVQTIWLGYSNFRQQRWGGGPSASSWGSIFNNNMMSVYPTIRRFYDGPTNNPSNFMGFAADGNYRNAATCYADVALGTVAYAACGCGGYTLENWKDFPTKLEGGYTTAQDSKGINWLLWGERSTQGDDDENSGTFTISGNKVTATRSVVEGEETITSSVSLDVGSLEYYDLPDLT